MYYINYVFIYLCDKKYMSDKCKNVKEIQNYIK